MIKKFIILVLMSLSMFVNAHSLIMQEPQMADAMRENGKIYVVIAVIAIIFVSIIAFLVYIERKLKKIENNITQGSGRV